MNKKMVSICLILVLVLVSSFTVFAAEVEPFALDHCGQGKVLESVGECGHNPSVTNLRPCGVPGCSVAYSVQLWYCRRFKCTGCGAEGCLEQIRHIGTLITCSHGSFRV